MKIAIYGKSFQDSFHDAIYRIFEKLNKSKIEIFVYEPFYNFISENLFFNPRLTKVFNSSEELHDDIEIIFSIGGDGTFLECAALLKRKKTPIVGINSGRLGFLASISKNHIDVALKQIIDRKYSIEKRTLLQAKVNNKELFIDDSDFALNELTVLKKDNSSMIKIEVFLDNSYLNTYWADGLIISTPTGSTAYSLSSGGPIILPGAQNFVITPIAPHTLTVRPIVVPNKIEIKIKVHGRGKQFLIALDSRSVFVEYNTEIIVTKADFYVNMVKFDDFDFFKTLRKKLMWGLDIRN